jgi:hypothetical protein
MQCLTESGEFGYAFRIRNVDTSGEAGMRGVFGLAVAGAVTLAGAATAQQARRMPPPIDPAVLNDEFDGTSLDASWKRFDAEYGWPDKVKALDVGKTTKGALHLEPYHSAWVRDLNAPFLFKTVTGDFDVRARVRMKGANGDVPGGTWSLGGLMARVPNGLNAGNWEPRRENWHFITTGVGHEAGKTMTETKGTYNSYSSLKLRPYRSGWIELRLVRVGMALFALARPEGSAKWEVRDRFYRMEGSPAMQVGLIAYTTSDDVPPGPEDASKINPSVDKDAKVDAVLEVDWIRAARPKPAPVNDWYGQVNGSNRLADPNMPEAEVLKLLGD